MSSDLPSSISLFQLLQNDFGESLSLLRCTKATLVHLSHTLEDLVLRNNIPALLFTGFQESSHWRKETQRYRALAEIAQQVCIFAGGTLPPESQASELHVTLHSADPLRQEWFLALLCPQFSAVLCGQDRMVPADEEATRQFDTLWSFSPDIVNRVLDLLENVIAHYRPERLEMLQAARLQYPPCEPDAALVTMFTSEMIRFEEELHQRLASTTDKLHGQLRWRDDLMATLVHDMRTPLNSLLMAIDMLRMTDHLDQTDKLHTLTVARRSAINLQDLIQLILDTNKLDEGQLHPQWQLNTPQVLVDKALEPLQTLLQANTMQTNTQIDQRISVMWGDESLLCRVVQNLVSNAIKFTQPGGRIDIGVAPAPNGQMIELRVRDTGRGISPKLLNHIFDRYYQGNENDRRGNGLGLYFCKLVVEAHQGTIRAVSQVGVGTSFTVSLPIRPPI